jgi:hypothetical protein
VSQRKTPPKAFPGTWRTVTNAADDRVAVREEYARRWVRIYTGFYLWGLIWCNSDPVRK